MLGKLAPGDVVTVTRIDRLARSTFDLFGIVKRIVICGSVRSACGVIPGLGPFTGLQPAAGPAFQAQFRAGSARDRCRTG